MVVKHLPSSVMKPDSRKEQTFVSTRLMLPPIVNSEFITWLKRKKAKIEGIQSFIRDWLVRNEKTAEMLYQGFQVAVFQITNRQSRTKTCVSQKRSFSINYQAQKGRLIDWRGPTELTGEANSLWYAANFYLLEYIGIILFDKRR